MGMQSGCEVTESPDHYSLAGAWRGETTRKGLSLGADLHGAKLPPVCGRKWLCA